MNSFRVISNVKLIASNVHTKKNHKHICSWFSPTPIILHFFNRHVYIFNLSFTFADIISLPWYLTMSFGRCFELASIKSFNIGTIIFRSFRLSS